MKRILTTLQNEAKKLLLLTVLAGAMTSCDSILDFDEGDCSIEYRVKFKYDYNILYADAFAQEVKTVTLYAFDNDGKFVYQKTEEGERLADGSYSMKVDIEPGDYHLVAWAGLNDQSFAVPLLTPGVSKINNLTVKTLRNKEARVRGAEEIGKYIVKDELSPLWHGEVSKQTFTRSGKQNIITIPLVKNTNNIRVVLAQVNRHPGQPVTRKLDVNQFDYAIYDDNGLMNYDNSLLTDNMLTYQPFATEQNTVTSRAFSTTDVVYPAAIAEISVARLLESQTPRLSITNRETGEELLPSGSLISYLNLLKQERYKEMPFQEYLDRESRFSMIFFVDENLTMIKTVIEINDWVIQINDIEL